MEPEKKATPQYQREAERIVDMMFDTKLFREDLTRKDIMDIENLLAYYFESFSDSVRRTEKFVQAMKKHGV